VIIWKAIIRPNLEYGAEVWSGYLNDTHKRRLRAIQHAAGVKIFKLNRRTKREAVNLITNTQSLDLRLTGYRLRYLARLFARDEMSLLRTTLEAVWEPSQLKGPQMKLWMEKLLQEIRADAALRAAYANLIKYLRNHENRLPAPPKKIHPKPPIPQATLWNPHYLWNIAVDEYLQRKAEKTVVDASKIPNSTLRVISRLVGRSNLLRRPNCGIDQIKARLLCGTSALRATTYHYRNPSAGAKCPICNDGREDTVHFVHECKDPEMVKLREVMEYQLKMCKCDPTCRSAYMGFGDPAQGPLLKDPEDKTLFMLGGPAKTRSPCDTASSVFDRYLTSIWEHRNSIVHPDEVIDLTDQESDNNPHSFTSPPPSLHAAQATQATQAAQAPQATQAQAQLLQTAPEDPLCSPNLMDGDPRVNPMSST
jgi:hypothetical protein